MLLSSNDDPPPLVHTGHALARVGLLGNPSDGYGGRVIALTLPTLRAKVTLIPSNDWDFAGLELLHATVEALTTRRPDLVLTPGAFQLTTTIPRQVGLSGSSAIIIAALRALASRANHTWDLVELARTALEVETEVLGWAAGPQDRVVQAYEGLVDMDFAEPWQRERYTRLDPAGLPPTFVAWNESIGEPSDVVHSNVRQRWLSGDALVVATMDRFAELGALGRAALASGTANIVWPALMSEAFELRSQIWNISAADLALTATGQQLGAGVALAGSGGAVVGSVRDRASLASLADAYDQLGAGFLVVSELGGWGE